MENLCGKTPYKAVKFMEGKGKTRKHITIYQIDIDSETHRYHKILFLKRINRIKYIIKFHNKYKLKIILNNLKLNMIKI